MKKLFVIILAVSLFIGGLGGFAYAQGDHQPIKGDKLVGITSFGNFEPPGVVQSRNASFTWSNPDCIGEVTIDRIALFRSDGAIVYQGPMVTLVRDPVTGDVTQEIPVTEPMAPHISYTILLHSFMKDPDASDPDRWLTPAEAFSLSLNTYTLEINYTTEKKGLPLIGMAMQYDVKNYDDGQRSNALTGVPMVNLKQRLK